jgi:hypothetical protein
VSHNIISFYLSCSCASCIDLLVHSNPLHQLVFRVEVRVHARRAKKSRSSSPMRDAWDGDAEEEESHDETPHHHRDLQDIDARLRDQDQEWRCQVQTLVQQMEAM